MDQIAEYILSAVIVAFTLYAVVRIVLARYFPKDT
jgi:hypothetical protein